MKAYEDVLNYLAVLKLQGIHKTLDEIITDAEREKKSYISLLIDIFKSEIDYRTQKRYERNMSGAHFPVNKTLETFETGKIQGIGKSEIINISDCRWIDKRENILFFGPPGVGKTHLSIGIGVTAVEKGYSVCFERCTNLMRLLKTAEIQKLSEYRIKRIMKSSLIIIDEIGYTPIEKREANLFFNMISQLHEKTSIVITSNKSFESWAEMMGDDIMTTALLDRLLHHARIFNLDGESYRLKNNKKEG
jgi:DNA replication protein DnaC